MQAKQWLLAFLLIPFFVFGQDNVTVKGRIINEKGESVEYVQVGIPKLQIGTISSTDGQFESALPAEILFYDNIEILRSTRLIK